MNKHDRYVAEFKTNGYCLVKGIFPADVLRRWNQVFLPLLQQQIAVEGPATSRGANRYYVTLPFEGTFADPNIFENADILAIVEQVAGKDFTMVQLASDTPILGSDYQDIHRDAPPLFPEWGRETPAFQIAVNFPLVPVSADNGPLEVVPGTHLLSRDEGMEKLKTGAVSIEPIYMELGDVLIRDVRGLHRGTPNRTDVPRPMVVIGYSRKWLYRPEVSIQIPRQTWESLSPRAKHMLRSNPVVDQVTQEAKVEAYQTFAY